MPPVRFERDQLPSTAWKNGGGRTREIVRLPPESGMDAFDWRASIADISADGPFSTFAGVDRVIVLLNGDGVRLRSIDGTIDHQLDQPLVPFAFSGDDAIVASLIGGASTDFNIMTRRAVARADVRVVRADDVVPTCSSGMLFAAQGTWAARAVGGPSDKPVQPFAYSLHPNSGVWWEGEALTWDLSSNVADGALIAVRVTRHSG